MKKSFIIVIFFLSLYSCGSYTLATKNKGYDIEYILAVNKSGDTIKVPYNSQYFDKNSQYTNPYRWDFNYNWNSWNYSNYWSYGYYGWNQPYFYWNNRRPIYYRQSYRPVIEPRTRVRVNSPRGRIKPSINTTNETNRYNIGRTNQPTQSRNNGRRSGVRQVVPTQPTQSRQPNTVQPRQIRRGSGSSVPQQSRSSQRSNREGRISSSRRQN